MKKTGFFFLLVFVLTSCGPSEVNLSSINFEACFMSYKNPSELTEALEKLTAEIDVEKPSASFMTVIGCINYQLGNYSMAQSWLTRAFKESKVKKTKSIAASALGLIYLKEFKKEKIKPYIPSAGKNQLGRWMLTLYHIDNYRQAGYTEHLKSAIKQMEEKNKEEGETTATSRFLAHMQRIEVMESACGLDPEGDTCLNLEDEKLYLFSTALGFLSMLIKEPPLNQLK